MATKRTTDRAKRRLMVRFGKDTPDRTAFTRNISESGVFVQTNNVFPPGTTIQIEIHFPEKTIRMAARVAWAKRVPAQLAHLLDCGMGVRFLEPGPEWPRFFSTWHERAK